MEERVSTIGSPQPPPLSQVLDEASRSPKVSSVTGNPRLPHWHLLAYQLRCLRERHDESVLEREIGGRQVMRDQLQHLLDLRRLPNISVRVIPKSSGAHVGLDGPVRIISLASRDLAYVGARRGGRLVETPEEVRELVFEFDLIGQKAASEDLSEVLIRNAMESMHDDRLA